MRISDWSSDVCSSDLIGEAPVLRPVLGGFDGRLGRESGGQRRERGPEGGALFPHLRRLFGPEPGAVAIQPAGGVEQRGRPLARSEEHTSELQSLMRISYADFCFKKKVIDNQNQNNPTNTIMHQRQKYHRDIN